MKFSLFNVMWKGETTYATKRRIISIFCRIIKGHRIGKSIQKPRKMGLGRFANK